MMNMTQVNSNIEKLNLRPDQKLYDWQVRFVEENKDRALLVAEMGCGKSVAGCCWIKLRSHMGKALVICPKAITEKWVRDLIVWGAKARVVSMSQIHKENLNEYSVILIDECHHFASPIFTRQRSQRTEIIYNFVKDNPTAHILLMSGTPIRASAWNAQTLGTFIGQYWDWRKFRATFFNFTDKFGRLHWEPKANWRTEIRPYLERISHIVLLKNCVDVPKQHETVIEIPWTPQDEQYLSWEYADASKEWHNSTRPWR